MRFYFECLDQSFEFPDDDVPFYRARLQSEGDGQYVFGRVPIVTLQSMSFADMGSIVFHIDDMYKKILKENPGMFPELTYKRREIDANRLAVSDLRRAVEEKCNRIAIEAEKEVGVSQGGFVGRMITE